MTHCGAAGNISLEQLNNLFCDEEAETDALSVQLFCRIHKTEQLKQAWLVLVSDPDARVLHLDF